MSDHKPIADLLPDAGQRRHLTGIGLMVLAMFIIPFVDTIAKELSSRYATTQIAWARYFFHFVLMLPLVLYKHGPRALFPLHPGAQILRGGLLMVSTFMYFSAVALIPLADALALVFIYPVVMTALSALVLKEIVGARRWSAVFVGLVGACIIIRPGLLAVGPGTLLALGAGITYACYLVATRRLANHTPPLVTLTFTALMGAVVFSMLVPAFWQTPSPVDMLLMGLMGALAACAHYLIIRAFDYAEASVLAPYGYAEVIMTIALGYLIFGDFPDAFTWLGIAIIIASGIYISFRERKRRVQVPKKKGRV
ncbi:MAG: DMT family transporter [Rhodospirillales bacterium]|nr:DMT family transporter [Rhodospirillales bacterium]